MIEHRSLPVPEGVAGERLDQALAKIFGLSRSRAGALCDEGRIFVDGQQAKKSDRLLAGAWLEASWTSSSTPVLEHTPVADLGIVYDDPDLVVIDKPAGVAAHPSQGWEGPTVVGALAASGFAIATSGAPERQGVVHRLDAGTSGLMVVAKSERAYTELKRAFHDREVTKIYHALAQGHPDPSRGTVSAAIGRHPRHDWKFTVRSDGKDAVTHYETKEAFRFGSLLEVRLETGRTHQIRVHAQAIGHPLVGDLMYGADPTLAKRLGLSRQWLHAHKLGFAHPADGRFVEFFSPYPADLDAALRLLGEP